MNPKFYISLFLRRLHYFLLILAVGSAVGITLAAMLPPVYVAQARLLVESEQIPETMAASTVQTGATEQLQIIQQRILTRANLLEMANQLQIYAGVSASPKSPDEIVDDLRKRARIDITGDTGPRGASSAIIVTVSFTAPNATLAATVTNELVTKILNENVSLRTATSSQTLDFFIQKVARLEQDLSTQSAQILKFKQENQDSLPDSLDFRRSQLAAEQERLQQMEREEAGLRDRRARMVELYQRTGAIEAPTAAPQTPAERQLQDLRDQLASALAVLSPTNPRVKMLQAQIATAEKAVAAQGSGAPVDTGLSAYDLQLADIDGQLGYLASQKAQVQQNMDALAKTIEATAGNALQLETYERDYANIRMQYDEAVAAKARAETGDLIEALSKGQRISVVEQAVAPSEPKSPNRPLLAAAGVGAGFMLGLAAVVLLEAMNRAIRRPVDLTKGLGITPFATLPYIRTTFEIRRRRTIILSALFLVGAGIPAALWGIDTYYMPLDLLLQSLMRKAGLAAFTGASGPVFG